MRSDVMLVLHIGYSEAMVVVLPVSLQCSARVSPPTLVATAG